MNDFEVIIVEDLKDMDRNYWYAKESSDMETTDVFITCITHNYSWQSTCAWYINRTMDHSIRK